ncbi:hypothetical protein RhiirA4_479213 [Rhizophagus irregularis]|uniref:Protein kinase domain-containing protein n=1 Tax=Rhizophagus irregularis TaxID=588596 RepID=A0A2I1HG43_9GLOM|nr:hypothetical protein RhiirA4_479213 [Rhizophagus irregularis]
MEYADGTYQISKALEYLHNEEILHRDLNKIKLYDFGLSKRIEEISKFARTSRDIKYTPSEYSEPYTDNYKLLRLNVQQVVTKLEETRSQKNMTGDNFEEDSQLLKRNNNTNASFDDSNIHLIISAYLSINAGMVMITIGELSIDKNLNIQIYLNILTI